MNAGTTDLTAFYEGPLGALARRLVGRALAEIWPDLRGQSLLGIGHAAPYLAGLASPCERAIAFETNSHDIGRWPATGCRASTLVDPLYLPLGDESIDRVLAVHALESVENPSEFLHEVSRILRPAGRVILVCPNRRGLWARMDTTPFGDGQPFSRSQLRALMRGSQLTPERWRETLYVPPVTNRFVLRSAAAWERLGSTLSLPFAGLHIVEASKSGPRLVPVRDRRRVARLRPVLMPVPATRDAS